jgi:hypothetical protein
MKLLPQNPDEQTVFGLGVCAALVVCGFMLFATADCGVPLVPITDLGACIVTRADRDDKVVPPMTDVAIAADVAAFCVVDVPVVIASLAEVQKAKDAAALKAGK